ncbi:hypothetical protein BDZ91DRAFT_718439 [Kalaharituber pfeilii]|nr:hypothetical protein BDZ91DRAFT_718439 [Kalaharituber pfeilii]
MDKANPVWQGANLAPGVHSCVCSFGVYRSIRIIFFFFCTTHPSRKAVFLVTGIFAELSGADVDSLSLHALLAAHPQRSRVKVCS